MSNGRPKAWVRRHRYDIARAGMMGGMFAGLYAGGMGGIAARQYAVPILTSGVLGGTIGGRAVASGFSRALTRILPAKTRYRMPKLPSAGQVIFSPVVAPFKIGEMFGTAWVKKRQARAQPTLTQFIPR
jgi:hypothetical protein